MSETSELQAILGVTFEDSSLLTKALTHSSYANENLNSDIESNERLEFLGDALLGYVVAQEIYLQFPSLSEGELTETRAELVRSETLVRISRRLTLGDYLYLGKGEEQGGGRTRARNLAGALEAVMGAVLLDQGPEAARGFILAQLEEDIRKAGEAGPRRDHKSLLQEAVQAQWKVHPVYSMAEESDSNRSTVFTAEARVGDRVLGRGSGETKRIAQRMAAQDALEKLGMADEA